MCKHPTKGSLSRTPSERWGTPSLRGDILESFLGHGTFQEGFEGSTVTGSEFGRGRSFHREKGLVRSGGRQPGHLVADLALLLGSCVAQGESPAHSEPLSASGFSGVVNDALLGFGGQSVRYRQ